MKKINVLSVISIVLLMICLFWSLKRQFELDGYIRSKKTIVTQNKNKDSIIDIKVRVIFIQNKDRSFKYRYGGEGLINFQNHFYFNPIGINLVLKKSSVVVNQELAYFNDNLIPSATFAVSSREYYKQGYITILIKKPDEDLKLLNDKGKLVHDIEDNSDILGIGIDKVLIMNENQFSTTTLIHEMCHTVGLAHVQDRFNIMYPYDTKEQIYLSEDQVKKFRTNLQKI